MERQLAHLRSLGLPPHKPEQHAGHALLKLHWEQLVRLLMPQQTCCPWLFRPVQVLAAQQRSSAGWHAA
jgi:hypothetical protein